MIFLCDLPDAPERGLAATLGNGNHSDYDETLRHARQAEADLADMVDALKTQLIEARERLDQAQDVIDDLLRLREEQCESCDRWLTMAEIDAGYRAGRQELRHDPYSTCCAECWECGKAREAEEVQQDWVFDHPAKAAL